MPHEIALTESRTLRESVMDRVEVLDKVKALTLLPDGIHLTTEGVAAYFEIHKEAVHSVVRRHREELSLNGMVSVQGSDLAALRTVNLTIRSAERSLTFPQTQGKVRLFTRRTVLNVAMLLRDSDIARRVRSHLLDAEESFRGQHQGPSAEEFAALDARLCRVEARVAEVGAVLQELGPLLNRIMDRLDRVERRVDATNRVLAALADRVHRLGADVRRLDHRVGRIEQTLRRQALRES
ncbi:hypothetical protein [Streptomyces aidingensis]|uniref:Uncharacterized protein n=1 Tax=Streptomyces aidingensis TaxID=910347 RepID=A0A1I1QF00_9ACTN|nr:hypothetical protein [Streptomyces aidingensis]SFD20691.1 hypothetical protein SAMN05421773_11169 [Streptomyces aidingensis]